MEEDQAGGYPKGNNDGPEDKGAVSGEDHSTTLAYFWSPQQGKLGNFKKGEF